MQKVPLWGMEKRGIANTVFAKIYRKNMLKLSSGARKLSCADKFFQERLKPMVPKLKRTVKSLYQLPARD